jgi:hypothetical protein
MLLKKSRLYNASGSRETLSKLKVILITQLMVKLKMKEIRKENESLKKELE